MAPKLLVAAFAVMAIAVGFILPAPHGGAVQAKSQIPMQEIGRS